MSAKKGAVTESVSVVVPGSEDEFGEVAEANWAPPPTPGEVTIDGEGGILVPGMYEMHAHMDQDGALLNLIAGITTVRDMGNDNAVLDKVIERINKFEIGGPRVVRSGFIKSKSPYRANHGIVVDSEAKAIDAVRWYGARGYWQVKIYNSINPEWVSSIGSEAHRLGMRVAGHVPAFSTADEAIEAGLRRDHAHKSVHAWVGDRSWRGPRGPCFVRLTGMKRFSDLDLSSPRVQKTVQRMVDGHKAIDPTLGIHEFLTLHRDGLVPPGRMELTWSICRSDIGVRP